MRMPMQVITIQRPENGRRRISRTSVMIGMRLVAMVVLIGANTAFATAAEKSDGKGMSGKCVATAISFHDYASCMAFQTKNGWRPSKVEAYCHRACPGG